MSTEQIEAILKNLKFLKQFPELAKKYKKQIEEIEEICKDASNPMITVIFHEMLNSGQLGIKFEKLVLSTLYPECGFEKKQHPKVLDMIMNKHRDYVTPGENPPATFYLPNDNPKKTDQYGIPILESKTKLGAKTRLRKKREDQKIFDERKAKIAAAKPNPQYLPDARAKRKGRAQKKWKERQEQDERERQEKEEQKRKEKLSGN